MSAEVSAERVGFGVGFVVLVGRRRYFLGLSRFVLLSLEDTRVHERNNCVCASHRQLVFGGLVGMFLSVRDRGLPVLACLGVGVVRGYAFLRYRFAAVRGNR